MDFNVLLTNLDVDARTLMDRFSGNQKLLQRFILKFPQEKTFEELSLAHSQGDNDGMERSVHTLKGITANLGFDTLSHSCADFLAKLRGKSEISTEFDTISTEYRRIVTCIEEFARTAG